MISPLERFPSYDPSDEYQAIPPNIFRQLDPVIMQIVKIVLYLEIQYLV